MPSCSYVSFDRNMVTIPRESMHHTSSVFLSLLNIRNLLSTYVSAIARIIVQEDSNLCDSSEWIKPVAFSTNSDSLKIPFAWQVLCCVRAASSAGFSGNMSSSWIESIGMQVRKVEESLPAV